MINDDATSSILRTRSSTDLSTSVAQIVVEYNGVDDGGGCSGDSDRKCSPDFYRGFIQGFSKIAVLKTSSSTNSSTSATQIAVEYDEVDGGGGKSVKKLSKSRKSLNGLKNLQKPSVWRNVYQSTDPPSKDSSFR